MDSECHRFSHAEKLPSPLHKDAESMEEAQDPEPRVRVSHLMSHPVLFFFSPPFQPHGFIFGGRQKATRSQHLIESGGCVMAAAPVNH